MARISRRQALLGGLAIPLAAAAPPARASASYQVIVHLQNPTGEVSRSFLRDAFLKRVSQWNHGESIRPVDLGPRSGVREAFTRDVLSRGVSEVKRYWQQQIFSGKGVPPPEMDSEAEVVAYVLKHEGAVGYLAVATDARGVRVVPVR